MIRQNETELTFTSSEGTLSAVMKGEIDHHSAAALREKIDLALYRERPSCLVLDFSGISFMDSSGLGLILGRLSAAGEIKATLRLSGVSSRILKILMLAGIDRMPGLLIDGVSA